MGGNLADRFQKQPWKKEDGGKSWGGESSWGQKPKTPVKAWGADKTVWIGGLAEGTTFKEILEMAKQVGDAKWAEMLGKSTAAVGFATPEAVPVAVSMLNGSSLGGNTLQADAWGNKE